MPTRLWPKPFNYQYQAKPFLVSLCVILALLLASLFFLIYSRTNQLILDRIRQQAIDYIDLIDHTKMWNFDYGGVYVEKRPGVESNVYLKKLGIKPDVKAAGGRTFTVRNHAIMTKEISRISEQHDGIKFSIRSLKPLDPSNTPDSFERTALVSFEKGAREASFMVSAANEPSLFRYMVPVYVDETCLECHSTQGYSIGDVIGGISLSIPVKSVIREQQKNKLLIIAGGVGTLSLLIGVCYFLTFRLVTKLDEAQMHLKRQAATDELTGLKNRRRIMSRLDEEYQRSCRLDEPLCLIVLDIDHFKRINDSHGHPFGDLVLKTVAERMQETLRKYDIVGRIGGEEFLIIAPGTTVHDAVVLAERVRSAIGDDVISDGAIQVNITASAGIAIAEEPDDTVDSLLKRADNALYKAKREGRNRVAVL